MIERSQQFDLGLDHTRIKDVRDADRQSATVDALLERFFDPHDAQRWELQILADEVGMGKTFVGLGVAYSVLQAMRRHQIPDDLKGCYQKILVVTPNNSALFSKWRREIGEFVKRCVKPEFRDEAARWFSPSSVDRLDELVAELRQRGRASRVVVASMRIFDGGRLRNYDLKRRHLLGVLFRYWGNRFRKDLRKTLLKGAPAAWSANPEQFDVFTDREQESLLFSNSELATAIQQVERHGSQCESLLDLCRQIAQPYVRERDVLFAKLEGQLNQVYRELMPHMIGSDLPLVLVDEAHNWKNGPSHGANGYEDFTKLIACRSRRCLLMTATPFQLRPSEMLEILKVGDHLQPCATKAASELRGACLSEHRENVLRPILDRAVRCGNGFAKAWSRLSPSISTEVLELIWHSTDLVQARTELHVLADDAGMSSISQVDAIIDRAVQDLDPDIRHLIRAGLRLYCYNRDLSKELGSIVIRHRRKTGHRLFRVGAEYQQNNADVFSRSDRHLLHASPGLDVSGDAELPHYLLMRCVSEMKGGKGRASLGSALTGCYSTLIDSAEGRSIRSRLSGTADGSMYLNLLMRMVNAKHDPKHPKVREVVDAVVRNWRSGEKTLIFCFRTNTAKRLHDIIDERVRKELVRHREQCMGGEESMKSLRTRLTGKDRDLIVLGMDRIIWSILWDKSLRTMGSKAITPSDLTLTTAELEDLARLSLKFGVDLLTERVDRVFLHRASEHIIACRLLSEIHPTGKLKKVLEAITDERWVHGPYGMVSSDHEEDSGADSSHFDERGVHSIYAAIADPDPAECSRIAVSLLERRERAQKQGQIPILDIYHRGPNLWLGIDPGEVWTPDLTESSSSLAETVAEIHRHIWDLTWNHDDTDWESRRATFQAIRRAVLRESVLLRLLPTEKERDDSAWGELLVEKLHSPLPQQRESTANRICIFLEDLAAASGSLSDTDSARFAMFDATRLRDQQFVALVSGVHGSRDQKSRERVFSGFNSPLLPEILICTSVGQEGIDLHRHCRHVIHFDLAWNPAVMEQRTGRTDRIGSKTFRERALSNGQEESFLEIGVPYLAGTYDERIYEELRLRAQTFEVLTGGDVTTDDAEGRDDQENSEGEESGLRFVPLPVAMIESMRVNLHVWQESVLSTERESSPETEVLKDCDAKPSDNRSRFESEKHTRTDDLMEEVG